MSLVTLFAVVVGFISGVFVTLAVVETIDHAPVEKPEPPPIEPTPPKLPHNRISNLFN